MNIDYRGLKVTLHSDLLDAPLEITDRVTRIQYSRSVRAPFERATVVLANYGNSPFFSLEGGAGALLFRPDSPTSSPSPDYWMVIQKGEDCLFWGYVSEISTSIKTRADSLVESPGITLSVSSWATLLSRCTIALTPSGEEEGSARSVDGAFYGFDDWGNRFSTLAEGLPKPYLGETLEEILEQLKGPKLPRSLSGKSLLEEIKLVYNGQTRDSVTEEDDPQPFYPVIGTNITGFLAGSTLARQSIWSLIQAAFNPSPDLVELFPSFEPNAGLAVEGEAALDFCVPTLFYRMKPVDPDFGFSDADNEILNGVYENIEEGKRSANLPSVKIIGRGGPNPVIKREGSGSYKSLDLDIVRGVAFSMSDANRVNAVWVKSPFVTEKRLLFGAFARAAINYPDVASSGARVFDVNWPLFPASEAKASAYENLEAVIDYAYLVYGDGEHYMSGTISLSPTLTLAPGNWYSIVGLDKKTNARFTFYISSVSHRIAVSNTGNIEAHTEVTYERGSFNRVPCVPREA